MSKHKNLLSIAANADVPVLILGESGSGKEVAAKTLHSKSSRANGPFIALNCGAIPQNLIESILEGSERGAFTGAITSKMGVVRAAEGGTLFLDEIGELPLQSQARLLRILQEKKVLPVGGTQEISVNFRLICATHRHLPTLVKRGEFREDLFFRLNVFPIHLPPLRERETEMLSIITSVWESIESENADYRLNRDLNHDEISALKNYPWPGNIRQLRNILERYHLLQSYNVSLPSLLAEESAIYSINLPDRKKREKAPEYHILEKTLYECGNNKSMAAKKLGISRGSLYYQLRRQNSPH